MADGSSAMALGKSKLLWYDVHLRAISMNIRMRTNATLQLREWRGENKLKTSRLKVLSETLSVLRSQVKCFCSLLAIRKKVGRTTLRIEPTAYGGNGVMIQNKFTLRGTAVATVLAALALFGQGIYAETTAKGPFLNDLTGVVGGTTGLPENSTDLSTVVTEIGKFVDSNETGNFCFSVAPDIFTLGSSPGCGSATPSVKFGYGDVSSLAVAAGKAMNYEPVKDADGILNLILTATPITDDTDAAMLGGTLTVPIKLMNVNEPNLVKDDYMARPEYVVPGRVLDPIRANELFEDVDGPDGMGQDGSSTDINVVYICANDTGAKLDEADLPGLPFDSASPGSTGIHAQCAANPAADATPATTGRLAFASVKVTNKDTDRRGNTTPGSITVTAGAPAGTVPGLYYARVYVASGTFSAGTTANDATGYTGFILATNLVIKVGANNTPQFAGATNAFNAKTEENSLSVKFGDLATMPCAGDLDESAGDMLSYTLQGAVGGKMDPDMRKTEAVPGKPPKHVTLDYTEGSLGADGQIGGGDDIACSLSLEWDSAPDYETTKSVDVVVVASDGWDTVEATVTIEITDKQEGLAWKEDAVDGMGGSQNDLIKALNKNRLKADATQFDPINLGDYIKDADDEEGEEPSAISYEIVPAKGQDGAVIVDEDGNFTFDLMAMKELFGDDEMSKVFSGKLYADPTGEGAAALGPAGTLMVDYSFTVRKTNNKPTFDSAGVGSTVSYGVEVQENSAGAITGLEIPYSDMDTDAGEEYTAHINGMPMSCPFKADAADGKVTLSVVEDAADATEACGGLLDYESTQSYDLMVSVSDGFESSDPVKVSVKVTNVNEAPKPADPDKEFDPVSVAKYGVATIPNTSMYFTDEDGDTRLFITAEIMPGDGEGMIEVSVEGLDNVVIEGHGVGDAKIALTASDQGNLPSATAVEIPIEVIANMPPALTEKGMMLMSDMVEVKVGEFTVVNIEGLFEDPDNGDMVESVAATTDDESSLLVVETDGGTTATLIGKTAGSANLVVTATDKAGNTTDLEVTVSITDNEAPMLAMPVEDQTLTRIDPAMVDISGTFTDVDGDTLEITVAVVDSSIASADIVDGSLTVTGLALGSTDITLTATDPDGESIDTSFMVTVENVAPVVAEAISDQTTTRVDDLAVDIAGTFEDTDGNDVFTYEISVEDGSIADVSLDANNMLMIVGKGVGNTIVTVTATDADGKSVMTTFKITIENIAPVAAASMSPVALQVGGESATQSIAGLFTDDGDELTYEIALSTTGIANAALSGMDASFAPVSRGEVTVTVTASDPHGGMASVSGTVTVGDSELKSVASSSLAGFGRALLSSVSTSVGARLMNDARDSDLTLDAWSAQDPQSFGDSRMDDGQAWNTINTATTVDLTNNDSGMVSAQSGLNSLQSMIGSQFALNLGTSDSPSQWSVWGNVDRQSYEGTGYDGLASSVYLGVDVAATECWLFGVALASNSGESDYTYGTATQTMDMSLTTVLPYLSYQPSNNTTLWGVAGFGSGELDTSVVGAENATSDLSANVAMFGGRQHLTSAGRLTLDLRGDAAMANIETDDGSGAADGLLAEVSRIRLGLEGSFTTDTGQGGTVTPFGQVNLRSDNGDGDTGTGVEISGGVRMASNAFTLEARGRTLVMHSADEYSENGFSLMATLNPSQSATGVSVTLAPRWGADAQGMNILWSDSSNPLQNYNQVLGINDGSTMSLETQVGYGLLVAQERMLLTPFVDVDVSDASRRQLLVGANLSQVSLANTNFAVRFALGRVEERTGETSGKVGLNATLSF